MNNSFYLEKKSNIFYDSLFDYFIDQNLRNIVSEKVLDNLYDSISEMMSRNIFEAIKNIYYVFKNYEDYGDQAHKDFAEDWIDEGRLQGQEDYMEQYPVSKEEVNAKCTTFYNDGYNRGHDAGFKKGKDLGYLEGLKASYEIPG
jgi:hypothetical protein